MNKENLDPVNDIGKSSLSAARCQRCFLIRAHPKYVRLFTYFCVCVEMSLALVTSVFGKYIKFYVCSKEVNKSPGPTQEMLSKSWWQLLLHRVLKFLLLKLRCAGSKRTNYWDVVLVICHKQIEDSRNWKTESPLILFDQSFSCGASSEEANLPQEFE